MDRKQKRRRTEDTLSQCIELQHNLAKSAPHLTPTIVPKGRHDDSLLAFCANKHDRDARDKILARWARNTTVCDYCHAKKPLNFITEWNIEFKERIYRLIGGKFVCAQCLLARDTDRIITLCASDGKSDVKKLNAAVAHMCAVNKIEGEITAQRCYNMAYSLKVLASDLPGLKLLDKSGKDLGIMTISDLLASIQPSKKK